MELIIGKKKHRVLIDDDDWELIRRWRLHVVYMARQVNLKITEMAMHRFLMDAKPHEIVDHIDGNRANNTRVNLRICTRQENALNRGMHKNNKTGVNGVFWNKWRKSYTARISINNVQHYLGQFNTIAAAEYALASLHALRGEYHRGGSQMAASSHPSDEELSVQPGLFEQEYS